MNWKWCLAWVAIIVGSWSASATTWTVNQTDGDDTAAQADTTGATPFQHLQVAINNAAAGETILVDPGSYGAEEGVYEDATNSGRSRIHITKRLTIKASNPAETTEIVGQWDDEETGLGDNAVRCVVVASAAEHSVLEGFTLRNGATANNSSKAPGRGGAVYLKISGDKRNNFYLINCTIRHCASANYGAVYFSTLIGCRITDCSSPLSISASMYSLAYFTLFDANQSKTSIVSGSECINCTFYNNDPDEGHDMVGEKSVAHRLHNALYSKTKGTTTSELAKLAVSNLVTETTGESMVDPANGNFNVRGAGVLYAKADAGLLEGAVLPEGYTWDNLKDPFGNLIDTNRLHIGAVQGSVPYVYLDDLASGSQLVISGATAGWTPITFASEITIALSPTATRPCAGLVVNGSVVEFEDLPNGTFTITGSEVPDAVGGYKITPIYTTDWYMAENGSDLNSGFTARSPLKTFAAALQNAVSGDTVHLAAGIYGDNAGETMTATVSTGSVRARVVVPAGVTLAGADREFTVIEGAAASKEDVADTGCGEDAIIGVYLGGAGAKVKDLTVRGGHSRLVGESTQWKNDERCIGGGIKSSSASRAQAYAENCRVTGCVAGRGAGVHNVTLVKCIVNGNRAFENAGAGYQLYATGTAFLSNTSVNNMVLTPYLLDHCSIVSNTVNAKGLSLWISTSKVTVRNTVVDGLSGSSVSNNISCCLFAYEDGWSSYIKPEYTEGDCLYRSPSEIVTDAEGRPVIGQNAGIGQANEDYYAFDTLGRYDLSGVPRVMNGAMDIGALEADYRSIYCKDIKLRYGAVTDVTAAVVDNDGVVQLGDGGALTADWVHKYDGVCQVKLTIPVSGEVSIYRDGVCCDTQVGPLVDYTYEFTGTRRTTEILRVAYEGTDSATFTLTDPTAGFFILVH